MVCRFVYNLRFAFSPDSQQKPGLEEEKICFFLLIQFQWFFAEEGWAFIYIKTYPVKRSSN